MISFLFSCRNLNYFTCLDFGLSSIQWRISLNKLGRTLLALRFYDLLIPSIIKEHPHLGSSFLNCSTDRVEHHRVTDVENLCVSLTVTFL